MQKSKGKSQKYIEETVRECFPILPFAFRLFPCSGMMGSGVVNAVHLPTPNAGERT